MADTSLRCPDEPSRVDQRVKELDRPGTNPKILAGAVAGTSEETAGLFGSGHTLAEDRTGPGGTG